MLGNIERKKYNNLHQKKSSIYTTPQRPLHIFHSWEQLCTKKLTESHDKL